MAHLNRKLLSPVDTAWLRMEDPTNLMMITGVFFFDEPLNFEDVKFSIERDLLRYDRFRQRVIQSRWGFVPPYWQDDPHFDLNSHLHKIALPAPGNQAALEELINDFMSTPLDFSKPLWQFHFVENYGQGCALVCRLHHSIADGIALMRVLLSLTQDEPNPPEADEADSGDSSTAYKNSYKPRNPFSDRLRQSQRYAKGYYRQGWEKIQDPSQIAETLKLGASSSAALARLLLLSPDPPTPFKGNLSVSKRCAWTNPIPLKDLKAIGKVTGGTVNDILLATVSGALGRYLRQQGEAIGGLDIRAVVPVNLRSPDEELKLGNAFGLVFLSLPIGISDPLDRLAELKKRMDDLKGTPEAIVAYGILTAVGVTTSQVEDIVVKIFGQKATAVMTNVPGPREVRYFAGKPIRGLMFWVPQSGRLGLGVSILSYAGEVLVGVATDAGLVPDPKILVDTFHHEFEAYLELAKLAEELDKEPAEEVNS